MRSDRFGRPWRAVGTPRAALLALAVVSAFPESAVHAGSRRCENRCGYRITQCMLERGGVDGREVRECTRQLVGACHTRPNVCPGPTPEQLYAALAEVEIGEATIHDPSLCATMLPDVPVADIEEALLVGRDTAAALAKTYDPTFRQSGHGYRGGAFGKLFLQGFFGHGAAFIPLGNAVVAMTRSTRAVTYVSDDYAAIVHGVVGVSKGRALGLLLTYCPD
jgi:hypothetical protein